MDAKGWQGADLVFDLDADHLPGVDPETANYRDMLLTCRQEAVDLVEMLREDFGFGDLLVTFSGNRGFHVHVHAEATRSLGQTPRREIVEYVRGEGLTFDALATEVSVAGGTDTKRRLRTDGGWGRRLHQDLVTYLERRHEESRADAIETVAAIPDMGETSAETVVSLAHDRWDAIQAGEIDLHRHFVRFVRAFLEAEVTGTGPAIDEPVTTDIRRLIRLPGSLHGGTGFRVQPIPPDALSSFDPTVDAIVSDFQSTDIAVELHEPFVESLGGTEWTLEPGIHELPEYLGLFMMARGVADKVRE